MGNKNISKVDDWLTEEKLELLKGWARDFTYADICAKIGITGKTFCEWRRKYPEIDEALKEGKEIVDYKVENALLKVALGYKTTEVKTIIGPPDRDGNRKMRVEKIEKELPPNPTAIMCWLNNRRPDRWKRNRDILQTEDRDNKIVVNIIKKGADKEDNEEWSVSEGESIKTGKAKKAKQKPTQEDLDYWPDDWSDDQ